MDGVCLLSEINPKGTNYFDPLRQAANWYGLVAEEETTQFNLQDESEFREAIEMIGNRAVERGMTFVVRDWSHVDWIGFPFVDSPPMTSSWTAVRKPESNGASRPNADPLHPMCATVRHPIDQYLSTKRLASLKDSWDEQAFWLGTRRFAESIQSMPWFRYEDFLERPAEMLKSLCGALEIAYDPGWQERWVRYDKVTGDVIKQSRNTIRPSERQPLDLDFWVGLRDNEDLDATLQLLGYPMPEPLRRKWFSVPGIEHAGQSRVTDVPTLLGKRWDDEVVRWRQACLDAPSEVGPHVQLAQALRWIGETHEAADLLVNVSRHCEEFPLDAQRTLLSLVSETLEKADRKFEAIEYRRRLAAINPFNKNNLFQLSVLLGGVGEVDESLAYCQRLLELDHDHLGAAANFLLYSNYSDKYTAAEIANHHFRLGMRFKQPREDLPSRARQPGERIRIGYLGSDFYTHPVGKIIIPILESHDREQFHVTTYHDGKKSDGNTDTARKAVDDFVMTSGWPDDQVFERIRGDNLDVLIELGGYTGGGNRLQVLSRRVAPIQISFLGYPNTSALPTIDYHFTDRFTDPPGLTEQLYGEQLVWLEHAMLAWRPYRISSEIEVESRDGPVLGLFNNVAKVSPSAIKTYANIMRRVPESKLILKYGDRFSVASLQDRYRREFAASGIGPHRLEFRTKSESLEQHLRTLKSVDLALDAFPYQGTMTSLECLSVGTPIVSCCGDFYAHRATSAMMMRMGLYELVAGDPDEYAEIAVQLLYDLGSLRELRRTVEERFRSGPLTDPLGLTREIEARIRDWVAES